MMQTFNPFAVWFMRPTHKQVLERQLSEALSGRIEHMRHAEYHKAQASMYERQAARLRSEISAMGDGK